MSRVGTFYSGYGGVRVPIGTLITDAGSLTAASAILSLNGGTFDGSTETAKLAAWIQAGCPGSLDATFYPSATTIVQMTNNTTPSGYTASFENMTVSGGYEPYNAFDRNTGTFSYGLSTINTKGEGALILEHPAQAILKYGIIDMGSYLAHMPSIFNFYEWDGSNWIDTGFYHNKTYTGGVEQYFTPSTIVNSTKTKIQSWCNTSGGSSSLIMTNFDIFGADLSASVIKCTHGLTTGAGVRVYSSGTLPSGLTANTTYYLREGADADKCTLYDTAAHAIAGGATGLIAITNAGSGTFKLYPYPTITVSNVTNGKLYI